MYPKKILALAALSAALCFAVSAAAQNAPSQEPANPFTTITVQYECTADALDRIANAGLVAEEEGLDAAGTQRAIDEKVEQLRDSGDCVPLGQGNRQRQEMALAGASQ